MRKMWFSLLLVLVGMSAGELLPPARSYKILMLLPASSFSHRNVFMPVAEALADRGHKIVMLSNTDKRSKHPNIQEFSHALPYFNASRKNYFEIRQSPEAGLAFFKAILPVMAKELYKIPKVKELYEKRKQFDLIVIDHVFNEMAYPFAHEMPFITIATSLVDPVQSAVLGNLLNPAYVETQNSGLDLSTVFGRLLNVITHIARSVYWRHWAIVPRIQKEITSHFPDLPPLLEIERNQSLALVNSDVSLEIPLPLLPTQVEVGGLHCRPGKPLPENLRSWIEGAGSAGVIYFSLGSTARGDTMPVKYRNMFLEAFSKLEQRVIWKFEADFKDIPEKVMINKWLPQQDILAHPNVKVFISHGGLLSCKEATYHGTPLLVLPIFGDQPKNGDRIMAFGYGLALVWETMTVDKLVGSLREILKNPKYKENISTGSKLMKDQLSSPKDRAVYWTEYVIRHKGAPRLRSPAIQLSWVEFLLLDVVALLLLIVVVVLVILRWILSKILLLPLNRTVKGKKQD